MNKNSKWFWRGNNITSSIYCFTKIIKPSGRYQLSYSLIPITKGSIFLQWFCSEIDSQLIYWSKILSSSKSLANSIETNSRWLFNGKPSLKASTKSHYFGIISFWITRRHGKVPSKERYKTTEISRQDEKEWWVTSAIKQSLSNFKQKTERNWVPLSFCSYHLA